MLVAKYLSVRYFKSLTAFHRAKKFSLASLIDGVCLLISQNFSDSKGLIRAPRLLMIKKNFFDQDVLLLSFFLDPRPLVGKGPIRSLQ